jgi:hypothetical protein
MRGINPWKNYFISYESYLPHWDVESSFERDGFFLNHFDWFRKKENNRVRRGKASSGQTTPSVTLTSIHPNDAASHCSESKVAVLHHCWVEVDSMPNLHSARSDLLVRKAREANGVVPPNHWH